LRITTQQRKIANAQIDRRLEKLKTLERMAHSLGLPLPPQNVNQKALVKPPISIPTSAGRAATALFQQHYALGGLKAAERFGKELSVFVWSVEGKKSWSSLVNAPDQLLPRRIKHTHLEKHMFVLGMSPAFFKSMKALFDTKDIYRLNQILSDYETLVRAWKREVDVKLVTKAPLDVQTTEFLKNTVNLNFLEPEDIMIFSTEVDPTILDGYRVIIKGVVHDFTTNKAIEAEKAAVEAKVNSLGNQILSYRGQVEGYDEVFDFWEKKIKTGEGVVRFNDAE
jgi:F0F1-type ATP synthase delta subunit